MSIAVVTTFSEAGYRSYGRRFLDSLLKHSDVEIAAYHEQEPWSGSEDAVKWWALSDDEEWKTFVDTNSKDPEKVGTPADFNGQSIKFCHKVFAVTREAFRSKAEWLVWMDADVMVHASPNWEAALPHDKSLVYLGREAVSKEGWTVNKVWRPICTETGFVAYRLTDGRVLDMLNDMRRVYTSGELYTWPKTDWHDAKVFDVCRERSRVPPDRWHNLSANVKGTDVWPHTVLAKWSTHQKGPARKLKAYGGIVS